MVLDGVSKAFKNENNKLKTKQQQQRTYGKVAQLMMQPVSSFSLLVLVVYNLVHGATRCIGPKCAQVRSHVTNLKADQSGRGDGGAIVLQLPTKK